MSKATAAPRGPNDARDLDEAREHYQRGYRLSQIGDYERAATAFRAAYEAAPSSAVLYNLGQALAASGRPVQAKRALERCLQEGGDELGPGLRAKAERALEIVVGRIGRLRVDTPPGDLAVFIDGQKMGEGARSTELSVGVHVVVALQPGFETFTETVEIQSGQDRVLSVQMKPLQGQLLFRCPVPAMRVLIDGKPWEDAADGSYRALAAGRYSVVVQRDGYVTERRSAQVRPREVAEMRCMGVLDEGRVQAAGSSLALQLPSSVNADVVRVLVDDSPVLEGALRRDTPGSVRLRLPLGPHRVAVEAPGWQPYPFTVDLPSPDTEETSVVLALQRTEASERELVDQHWQRSQYAVLSAGVGAALLVTSGVLYTAALWRHKDWTAQRAALDGQPVDAPGVAHRLRESQVQALRIQRLNDAAIAFGVAGALGAGVAAGLGLQGDEGVVVRPEVAAGGGGLVLGGVW